ncbi:MAG: flagellar basal body P-ring protein FlgI [Planctomycetota bacterium]|nr:flagellar basal body P-ring protein FlgI [Planctomycetota bacterium]
MPKKVIRLFAVGVCLCAAGAGCKKLKQDSADKRPLVTPPHISGTVAEYARLLSGDELPVQGYGVVVGLGTSGSAEVPAHVQEYLRQYLLRRKLGWYTHGTEALMPKRILRDLDTAVVLVGAAIPPGAPAGSRFDVFVSAMPQTQTTSLDGGILWGTELRLAVEGKAFVEGPTLPWAEAGGPIFVNPFIDPTKPAEAGKLRTGRIIGGGINKRDRQIRLQLRRPDYAKARRMQQRINARFRGVCRVANARDSSIIELKIPQSYRDWHEHFLQLVLHLPLRSAPGSPERKAREIAAAMAEPTANHEELSLVWEAMGRQVLPIVREYYTSGNAPTAFYSARTGLRLRDTSAAEVILRFATSANSALQIPAVKEIGRHRRIPRGIPTLRRLVDDENELVRIAAYESLLKQGDQGMVRTIDVSGQFKLDLVNSSRGYTIYATQTSEPRIALFGKDMAVSRPLFFNSPDDLLTINARAEDTTLTVFRKIPRTGGYSDTFQVAPRVEKLVVVIGSLPERNLRGEIKGLGLAYSQVVGVLYRLCYEKDIRAKFVLQPLPSIQRIYSRTATVGRPDTPD